jgi:hypothetical protein
MTQERMKEAMQDNKPQKRKRGRGFKVEEVVYVEPEPVKEETVEEYVDIVQPKVSMECIQVDKLDLE